MKYKRIDDTIFVRIDSGEEILEQVQKVVETENIKLATVNAIGAINEFTVGVYSVPEKKYYATDYTGVWEIASLMGTITTMNDQFYAHLHLCAGGTEGRFVGGHMNRAVISATCEMTIRVIEGRVDRVRDENVGLNVWDL